MSNEPLARFLDESLRSTMHALADYIINDLSEVQNSGELSKLLDHTDPEIRQAAVGIYDELSQFIVNLGKI